MAKNIALKVIEVGKVAQNVTDNFRDPIREFQLGILFSGYELIWLIERL